VNKASKKRLKLSNFKLNVLLDITQAINENLSKGDLLRRYEKLLREELGIGKILVYKFDESWECLLSSGLDDASVSKINFEKDLLHINEITYVTSLPGRSFESFDIIMPVLRNNQPLAFVLIGDIDEEGEGVSPTIKHLHFIQTLSNIIVVAIENMRLFSESLRQEALKKELELASKMQNMLIPGNESLPQNDRIKVSAFYHPHLDVGGDYYDVIELNENEVGFCIADVSGKGISAALLMSNFQANLRALFTHEITLSALLDKLNTRVMNAAHGEKFITIFIARYNYKTRELEYINAGHNPPLMYNTNTGQLIKLTSGCVGMGMLDEIPIIKKGFLSIDDSTKMLCYTDGIVELISEGDVLHETTSLEESLNNNNPIENNISEIIKKHKIEEGSTAIFDDISLLGIEII
jgi:sigma-B regulation protein RsbU (phosphoserine phosphatase)